uniref:Endoglucanase n=1 Tax=Kalanchoe fedtschenkoi TaxID=63787 RepID=A0A7N0T0X6_KALFE
MVEKGREVADGARWENRCWLFLVMVMTVFVALAAGLTLWPYVNSHLTHSEGSDKVDEKYSKALKITNQFFDIQKSGKLEDNRIPWRGDSGLEDGMEVGLDLSKGMYDAGDLMKFGFPMAFTATILSWSILEHGDQWKRVNEFEHAQESLKWITDYLINAHLSDNVLYIQVGDPELDHRCWERPEAMSERRPLTQINTSYPGTEVAAETAAAMAAASLVFKKPDSTYSSLLLKHARKLFSFANTYRGSYSSSVPQVQKYYNSSGFEDELLWAAAWLYHATSDPYYLNYATVLNGRAFGNWGSPTWFSWDDKSVGTQVLLSRVNFFNSKGTSSEEILALQMYRRSAEAFMCVLLPDSPRATTSRTNGGLIWVMEWNPIQYAAASAFLANVYSDYMLESGTHSLYCDGKLYSPADLRNFAISQADYVLGDSPLRMSYLVGYGDKYPQYVHHRGASIPVNATTGCSDGFVWLESTHPNPNVAIGAVVGGPFKNDSYIDSRNNSMQGEPTTYNAALLAGLLAGLVSTSSVPKSFT